MWGVDLVVVLALAWPDVTRGRSFLAVVARWLLSAAVGCCRLLVARWPYFPDNLAGLSYHVLTSGPKMVYCRVSVHPMIKGKAMTTTITPVHFRCSVRNVLHVAGLDMSPVFATYFEADAYGSMLARSMARPGVRFDVTISETSDPVTHKCLGGQVARLDGDFPSRLTVEPASQAGFGF